MGRRSEASLWLGFCGWPMAAENTMKSLPTELPARRVRITNMQKSKSSLWTLGMQKITDLEWGDACYASKTAA